MTESESDDARGVARLAKAMIAGSRGGRVEVAEGEVVMHGAHGRLEVRCKGGGIFIVRHSAEDGGPVFNSGAEMAMGQECLGELMGFFFEVDVFAELRQRMAVAVAVVTLASAPVAGHA